MPIFRSLYGGATSAPCPRRPAAPRSRSRNPAGQRGRPASSMDSPGGLQPRAWQRHAAANVSRRLNTSDGRRSSSSRAGSYNDSIKAIWRECRDHRPDLPPGVERRAAGAVRPARQSDKQHYGRCNSCPPIFEGEPPATSAEQTTSASRPNDAPPRSPPLVPSGGQQHLEIT